MSSELRVDQWKRKLLDLSLRNPLPNARDGAKFLPFDGGAPYGSGAATTDVIVIARVRPHWWSASGGVD